MNLRYLCVIIVLSNMQIGRCMSGDSSEIDLERYVKISNLDDVLEIVDERIDGAGRINANNISYDDIAKATEAIKTNINEKKRNILFRASDKRLPVNDPLLEELRKIARNSNVSLYFVHPPSIGERSYALILVKASKDK